MLAGLSGWHLLILLAIVILLFGAAKLPVLARSVGQSLRIFRGEVKAMRDDDEAANANAGLVRPGDALKSDSEDSKKSR